MMRAVREWVAAGELEIWLVGEWRQPPRPAETADDVAAEDVASSSCRPRWPECDGRADSASRRRAAVFAVVGSWLGRRQPAPIDVVTTFRPHRRAIDGRHACVRRRWHRRCLPTPALASLPSPSPRIPRSFPLPARATSISEPIWSNTTCVSAWIQSSLFLFPVRGAPSQGPFSVFLHEPCFPPLAPCFTYQSDLPVRSRTAYCFRLC